MTSFIELGLAEPILKALETEGYTTPTPIQAQAIPGVMAGKDLLGIAQTGTGKTAAFALPILHRLAADKKQPARKGCRVLVLSPTRELASQIADSFRTYGKNLGVSVAVVYGGVAHRPQVQAMHNGVDVLVATPGRLIDHMDERNIALESTEIFVLDEADQMLDLGFLKSIRRVVARLSMKRQNLFFSATMPQEIGKLASELLRDPVRVSVAPTATTVDRVDQRVIHIEAQKKRTLLVELLANPEMARTLVFTRTKRGADKVARHLETAAISVTAIHGNKSQVQRERALDAFRDGKIRVLVATDIAARGIDIDLVTHVINYELPEVPEAYVHRIGRTARAGAAGIAISLCAHEERGQLREIERTTRQTIAAVDRRNDATLAADKQMPREDERPDPRSRGPRRGDDRRDRSDARPRKDGHSPRSSYNPLDARPRPDLDARLRPDTKEAHARNDAPRFKPRSTPDRAPAAERDRPQRASHASRPDRPEKSGAGFDVKPAFLDRPARGEARPQRDRDHQSRDPANHPHRSEHRPHTPRDGAPRGDRSERSGEHRPSGPRNNEHRGRDNRGGEHRSSDSKGSEHRAREPRAGARQGRDNRGGEPRGNGPSPRPHAGKGGPRRFGQGQGQPRGERSGRPQG